MAGRSVFEVFAGCGGLAYGLHRAGFEHVGFCEIEPYPRRILQRHFPGVPVFGDVREIVGTAQQGTLFTPKIPEFDVLAGGPPCQPASVAGSRGGSSDDRWLWGEFLDLVERYRPSLVFAENVAGLPTLNGGHEFGLILRRLASLGYVTSWTHCPAGSIGAPHIRDRVFLAARPGTVTGEAANPKRWPRAGRWVGDLVTLSERWPKAKRSEWPWLTAGSEPAARMVPNPTTGDAKSSGSRNTSSSSAHSGTSLTDYVRGDGGAGRMWPTPNAGLVNYDEDPEQFLARRARTNEAEKSTRAGLPLGVAARMYPTPCAADAERVKAHKAGNPSLESAAGGFDDDSGTRLAPEFAEWLQGWPQGWTAPTGPSLLDADPLPWTNPEPPEVPRLVAHDKYRRPRLKCTGNGVCAPVAELLAELDWL